MEMLHNMICEFVRFDSQVDWKICVECFCVCVPFLSKCIHSSCVKDQKEPKRLFFVGVSRMAKSCWSCVKQNAKKLPLIYEVSCENTHVRSHFSKCRMKCTLACIVCTDKSIKCTLQTQAGGIVHVQVCDYVWEVNAIMFCYQAALCRHHLFNSLVKRDVAICVHALSSPSIYICILRVEFSGCIASL